MNAKGNITVDAVALQERDEFRPEGWTRVFAPAKVNLHLAIGPRRDDGYHEAATVMHALNLHDVVFLRRRLPDAAGAAGVEGPLVRMVAGAGIEVPNVASEDNLAAKAVVRLAEALQLPPEAANLEIRIEKNIPAQAGLGGGSADAAAALLGAASLWGVAGDDDRIETVARTLGADVAFFLHGGCAYLEGTGDQFVHALEPSRASVVLVKPEGGVSTAEAYRRFDEAPAYADDSRAAQVRAATEADAIDPFNNLAAASERIMPELAEVRQWLEQDPRTEGVLLCGSGAATFALCDNFQAACTLVAQARARGWWARATALGAARCAVVKAGA